ncbi:MAG: rRNA methylase [Candidatus Giovannonibacteria bacterium GW2011_GWA1_44_25]|uniref:rRNA methylase n=1 Tax=Candidatus Giovannonibacteria bacterium GW2011_GWA1_44_25 TaxID=1618645 RepID=A0A0G1IHI6_9BACT|nr:MAG: rRNA methylase [Candidatus Giovannonibacteria bacterium GW2011_GWA1_44_25]
MKDIAPKTYIYGKHALMEALRNSPHAVEKVLLAPQGEDKEVRALAKSANISVIDLSPKTMLHDIDSSLVILGEIQDPQNVGAIIRSAAAFGVAGVLIPEHNQAPITGTVVKVSAGMAFRVPLVSIGNVNTTARDLKERGFWIYGLQGDAPQNIATEKFDAPAVFIFGNEATGIRLKTRELCDILLSIPMNPGCESLNVSASAAVALYAWSALTLNICPHGKPTGVILGTRFGLYGTSNF